MAIVWTGTSTDSNGNIPPGATDALDYFSLLYAHVKGSKWLDFGPSRPDLFDGIMRYKRKWGSVVTPGFFRQPSIFFTCNTHNEATQEYLAKHAFLSITGDGLVALMFPMQKNFEDWIQNELPKIVAPGISRYRIASLRDDGPRSRLELDSLDANVDIIRARTPADALITLSR